MFKISEEPASRKRVFCVSTLVNLIAITIISTIIGVIIFYKLESYCNVQEDSLLFVQVLFRHGDRTPEPGTLYKNDPYRNFSFYPSNYGELTHKGRIRIYNIGKALRKRYDKLLGDKYYSNLIKSYVSGYDRTQMSLQCVHAGLFSNENSSLGIPWRPITYHIFEFYDDDYIGIMASCRNMIMPKVKPTDEETIKLFQYLTKHTGQLIETYDDIINIGNAFYIETQYGLPLPEWTRSVYPEPFESADMKGWDIYSKDNLRYGTAGLLKMITDAAFDWIHHESSHKMYLYSGHDYNLLFLLDALEVWNKERTNFGAYIIFELHRINGEYGFKLFYNSRFHYDEEHVYEPLYPPFCTTLQTGDASFCSLHDFIKFTRWLYEPQPTCS